MIHSFPEKNNKYFVMGWTLFCCIVNKERSKKGPPIAAETVLDFSRCNLLEIPNSEFDFQDPE